MSYLIDINEAQRRHPETAQERLDNGATNGSTNGAEIADILRLYGESSDASLRGLHVPVPLLRLRPGESLVHEGAPADSIFFVNSGTFKVYKNNEDGYEQVLAFAIRGELVGFDALCMDSHPATIAAIETSSAYAVQRRDIPWLSREIPAFGVILYKAGSLALTRSRAMVDILAPVCSEVRLARFLIQLSERMAASGQSPRRLLLRMGRREIASLLGVAHETASRGFTTLAALGMVKVSDRDVELLDIGALKAYSRSTRRTNGFQSARDNARSRVGGVLAH